jgi:hypothetical protein
MDFSDIATSCNSRRSLRRFQERARPPHHHLEAKAGRPHIFGNSGNDADERKSLTAYFNACAPATRRRPTSTSAK